jgi:hypothetical protein
LKELYHNRQVFTYVVFLVTLILLFSNCKKTKETEIIDDRSNVQPKEIEIIDDGRNIKFVFDEGLNDDTQFKLPKDGNGYYYMTLTKSGQNLQRVSVRLLDGDKVVDSKCCGKRQKIEWKSNLFWWIKKGDTVENITKTYFNPFTGVVQYVNLPPLINWKDELVTTINSTSITNEFTGRGSTVIGPIGRMKGDTMTIYVRYSHEITKSTVGSKFYTSIGNKQIIDSLKIILK